MYHVVQFKIDEEWKTFFEVGGNLDSNCEIYRGIRVFSSCYGVKYPCRLRRVTKDGATDGGIILTNQLKYPEINDAITKFVEANEIQTKETK